MSRVYKLHDTLYTQRNCYKFTHFYAQKNENSATVTLRLSKTGWICEFKKNHTY